MRKSPLRGSLRSPEPSTARQVARFLAGLACLVVLDQVGNWLVRAAHAPVPGSVVGMLLLTVLLERDIVSLAFIAPTSTFLVRHLALLYVPAGVALVSYVAVVRHDLVAITVAALASLIAVLVVVGITVQRLGRNA